MSTFLSGTQEIENLTQWRVWGGKDALCQACRHFLQHEQLPLFMQWTFAEVDPLCSGSKGGNDYAHGRSSYWLNSVCVNSSRSSALFFGERFWSRAPHLPPVDRWLLARKSQVLQMHQERLLETKQQFTSLHIPCHNSLSVQMTVNPHYITDLAIHLRPQPWSSTFAEMFHAFNYSCHPLSDTFFYIYETVIGGCKIPSILWSRHHNPFFCREVLNNCNENRVCSCLRASNFQIFSSFYWNTDKTDIAERDISKRASLLAL